MRTFNVTAGAIAGLMVATGSQVVLPGIAYAAPPSTCTIARLPEPKEASMSIVTAADPTGRYVAGRGYPEGDTLVRDVVVWDRGVPKPVNMPGIDQQLADFNSSGVAVGFSFDEETWEALTPWRYHDGVLSPLPGVESGIAVAINERGDILGSVGTSQRPPFWWPAGGGGPVDLPVPEGALQVDAFDIDEDGTIVGVATDAEFIDRAVVWQPGEGAKVLPVPAGAGPNSRAFGIRNGWVTGFAFTQEFEMTPLRWNLRTGEVRAFPQFFIRPDMANMHGWLVGSGMDGRGLFVSERGDLRLPGLANHGEALGDIATNVSDDGRRIAGQALDAGGEIRAVQWTCR
jgi:hypothetical protein